MHEMNTWNVIHRVAMLSYIALYHIGLKWRYHGRRTSKVQTYRTSIKYFSIPFFPSMRSVFE